MFNITGKNIPTFYWHERKGHSDVFFKSIAHNITKIGLYVVPGVIHVHVGARFVGGKELVVTQQYCARKKIVNNIFKFLNKQTYIYVHVYKYIYMYIYL